MVRDRGGAVLRGAIVATLALLLVSGTSAASAKRATSTATTAYSDPAWAPNGKRIAFVETTTVSDGSVSLSSASLLVAAVDGTGVHEVATLRADRVAWPSWSPDSRRIAFGRERLYVVNADGRKLREIATGCCVAWGPGGRSIAFSDGPETQSAVYVVGAGGGQARAVAQPDQLHSYWGPSWSRRGSKLAFFSDEAPDQAARVRTSLGILERFGGRVRHVGNGRYAAPAWSPDGRTIAADGIRLLDLRTGRSVSLRRGVHPSWSPDGRRIAFAQDGAIYVMNRDGSGVRRLSR